MYMLVAMTAVGTLLIFSFSSFATILRSIPEAENLDRLLSGVATKATELLTTVNLDSSIQVHLDLPTRIGNREYWIRLDSNNLQSWVEGGLGKIWNSPSPRRIFLPGNQSAFGYYTSDYGPAILECHMNGSIPQLVLSNVR